MDDESLLPETRHRAGVTGKNAKIEVADIDTQFQRVGTNDRRHPTGGEVAFQFPPFVGQQSPAIRLHLVA